MKNVVLIFGSGRSGTSWLAETLSRPRGYRLLFEPEHEMHVPRGKVLTDRLLNPETSQPDVDKFLGQLFRNRIDNDWIAQHSYRKYKMHLFPFLVKKIIVKFVRCNLGMHYMTERFKVPAVYICRDPYSTIHSQQRVNFPWLSDLANFQNQPELVSEIIDLTGKNLFEKEMDTLQKLAFRWSIENVIPFRKNPQSGRIIKVNYSELKGNRVSYLKLLERLNLNAPENLDEQLGRPSSKTHPRSSIHGNTREIALFTPREKAEIDSILDLFGYPVAADPENF